MCRGMNALGLGVNLERGPPGKCRQQGPGGSRGRWVVEQRRAQRQAEPHLSSPALEIMKDVVDDVKLGIFINVPNLRRKIFELVLLRDILHSVIRRILHLGTLWERYQTVTTITVVGV